ncbi:MAG: alpha/beta hydrolase family protein [Acidimicrobiales bacterium]
MWAPGARVAVTALCALGVLTTSCGGSGGVRTGAGGGAAAPRSAHVGAADHRLRPRTGVAAVVTRRLVMVDTSRPTLTVPGHSKASPVRRIPVLVVYPADRHGRLPLVVFLHGINSSAAAYSAFLDAVAGFGYVVAAPDSPETTGGTGLADIEDFTVLPGDARFVITELTAGVPGLPGRLVDPGEIAVAGHSFGGAGAYGIGYNTCCRDPRVRAVLTLEGALLPYADGHFVWHGPPLLMVVGTRDPLIPVSIARKTLASMTTPADLLALPGADHTGGLWPGDVGHAQLLDVVKLFLAATLDRTARVRSTARDALDRLARRPGSALTTARGGA